MVTCFSLDFFAENRRPCFILGHYIWTQEKVRCDSKKETSPLSFKKTKLEYALREGLSS